MLGGGIMVNFVSYEALKPNVDIDEYPEFKTMDEMKYPFMRSPIVESEEVEKKEQPKTEVKPTQKQKKLSTIMYKGVARDLTNAIKIINESEPTNIKHMCTRAVSNALEGIRDVHRASGVENPRAMYNLLKKDGWTDVLDENYTPQAGDVWTYYANDKKMHTSMFDGQKWMSYDVEGQQPWYYGYRNDGKGHIQRYVPKAQLGMKFVEYIPNITTPNKEIPKKEIPEFDFLQQMPFLNRNIVKEEIKKEEIKEEQPTYYRNYDDFKQSLYGEPKNDAQRAVNFFMKKGLSRESASGLVGNLIRESQLQPNAVNKYSKAYGIAQWLGDRKTKLFAKYGNNPTFEQQLQYVWDELNTTHTRGLQKLKESRTSEEAARNAFGYYEFSVGPEGAVLAMNKYGQNGKKSLNEGVQYANELYNSFKIQKPQQKPLVQEPVSLKIN